MTATAQNASTFSVLDPDPIRRVELALDDMRAGRMVILVDDEDRENEGDLVIAASKCTPEAINFMATHGRGLICLSLTSDQVSRLGLSMMATNNQSMYNTAFTVSIEAREGVSTGISAADRAHTVHVAIDAAATPRSVVVPGHMFPLQARDGGVLERVGQTEGSVDLARLAGLNPAGVICEIMKDDGTMARLSDLKEFGRQHEIRIVAVADIIKYRMRNERIVKREAEGRMTVPGLGEWTTRLYSCPGTNEVHFAMFQGIPSVESTVVRVQAAPPAWAFVHPDGSVLSSQARASMEAINNAGGGAIVFMHANGGMPMSMHRAFIKDFGGADLPASVQPRADQLRDLGAGCQILLDLGLRDLRLLTGSNRQIVGLEAYGLRITERIPLIAGADPDKEA